MNFELTSHVIADADTDETFFGLKVTRHRREISSQKYFRNEFGQTVNATQSQEATKDHF